MIDTEKAKPAAVKKQSGIKRFLKWFFGLIVLILILLVLSVVGINIYLHSHKTKILNNLEFLNQGTITFDSTHIRLFEDFPHITIALQNFTVHDAKFPDHDRKLLKLEELKVAASLEKFREREMEIQSLKLRGGEIRIFKDELGFSNLKHLLAQGNEEGIAKSEQRLKLLTKEVEVMITDVKFHFDNAINTNSIHADIEKLTATLSPKSGVLHAKVDFNLLMEEMSFKKINGSFVEQSHLSGMVDFSLADGVINFEPFELAINEETFIFSGSFDTQKKTKSKLVLANFSTLHQNVSPLLMPKIEGIANLYFVNGPFYSKTTISGFFLPDENVLINVDFILNDNDVTVKNKLSQQEYFFSQVKLKGNFVNRLYSDGRIETKSDKNLKVLLSNVEALHDGFQLNTESISIYSTAKNGAFIKSAIEVSGQPSDISRWLKNDKFFFENGNFNMQATIAGSLKNFDEILLNSEVDLILNDFSTIYRPSNTAFPFEKLALHKKSGDAKFSLESSTLEYDHDFDMDGALKNMIALILEMDEQTSSSVNFVAEKIGWLDFVNLFGESGYLESKAKSDEQKKQSMKETLRGINQSFEPRLSIQLDTLTYYKDLTLTDILTGVHFSDENTIILEKTSFKIGTGKISFQAKIDITEFDRTPIEYELNAENINLNELLPPLNYLNIKLLKGFERLPDNINIAIKHNGLLDDSAGLIPHTSNGEIIFEIIGEQPLSGTILFSPALLDKEKDHLKLKMGEAVKTDIVLAGDPEHFNRFFKTNQYFFDKGEFQLSLDYIGDLRNITELFQNSNANLSIQNSEVYYSTADVTFPLSIVELELQQDEADFDLLMRADTTRQEINISGKIENISQLIVGNTGKDISTKVNFLSKKIRWNKFLDIFAPTDTSNQESTKNVKALKSTLKGVLNTFQPDLFILLDTFAYSKNLVLHDMNVGLKLKDSTTLILENTDFNFYDGNVSIDGLVDLSKPNSIPFSANFKTEQLDLAALLKGLNYLGIPSLKEIDRLSSSISMDFQMAGVLAEDSTGLINSANDGELNFVLRNVLLEGYEPLDQLSEKIFLKKRLKKLEIRELSNVLKIQGNNIEIPLMEIQSNALNIFVEGTYSYGDDMNLWISIPIKNLKSRNLDIIPDKNGYARAGAKVYLEVTSDENGENQFKFHLTKRKFYKQRGIWAQYKSDKRALRKERREAKRKQ